MTTLQEISDAIQKFRDARDWKQFHTPKEIALSMILEAGEVAELFQWKKEGEVAEQLATMRDDIGRELSDVLYWVVLMAHDCGIDLGAAFFAKMAENAAKYPVDRARGSSKKYSDL